MTTKDELPIPDYDHLPVGSLATRIRSLEPEEVDALLAYEQAHGDRVPVVQVLRRRLEQLAAGSEPTDGDPNAPEVEVSPAAGGSVVSPQTEGPKINPPSQGVPTNPAQPRS
jgi:hypothetical protein